MSSDSPSLTPPVNGVRFDVPVATGLSGYVACWERGPSHSAAAGRPPLLLVHSVNAAGSAYEMGPLFEYFAGSRRVVAMELPGFGHSSRPKLRYSLRQMTDSVAAVVEAMGQRYGTQGQAIDAMALSLGCEFLARAANERPGSFNRVGLISPTGFDGTSPRTGSSGAHRGSDVAYRIVANKPWSGLLYRVLTSRPSLRFFLRKTFGADSVDDDFVEYDYVLSRQPGAVHAPLSFLSGYLFSQDVFTLYDGLTQPVWLAHGTRGDFVDYRLTARMTGRPNWAINVFEGGALPHFEQLERVVQSWEVFEGE